MREIEIEICTLNGTKWILGDEATEQMTWGDAKAWCESIGQELPPREVLLMAYLNPETRSEFSNNYYWSSSGSDSDFAWNQNFGNGYQSNYNYKDTTLPVRAVRAIKVEELLAQPVQEPVAWISKSGGYVITNHSRTIQTGVDIRIEMAFPIPLYASLPTREPLSDVAISHILDGGGNSFSLIEFARAVEVAHGINY